MTMNDVENFVYIVDCSTWRMFHVEHFVIRAKKRF